MIRSRFDSRAVGFSLLRTPLRFAIVVGPLAICFVLGGCAQSTEEQLGQIRRLQSSGRIEESIPLLAELIDSGNRQGEILYRYGRALSLTGYQSRSIWALDAAMSDPDWLVNASHQLALNAFRARNYDFGLEILERLRNERADSHEDDLPARLLEARTLLATRRHFEEALEQIELILDDFPDEDEPLRLRAVALLGLKQTDEAYELIREAGISAGELASGNRVEEQEAGLDLAPELDTDKLEAYWCTVRTSFKREAGELEEAAEIADECLARFPSAIALLNEAITVHTALNRYDRILALLRAAYAEEPQNSTLRQSLVEYLATIGLSGEAESILRKAVEDAVADEASQPDQVAALWVRLGVYLVDRESVLEALDAFDKALEILGERASPHLLFRVAEAMIVAERYDEAIAIASRTPIEVHRPMLRGRIAFERGDYEAAIEELDGAARIWPDRAPIRYYLARAAEGMGDFDRAIEEYRQAIRSDSALSAARERLTRLHLAEDRVRHALTILHFISPSQHTPPSTTMHILGIEAVARLGREPDLSIPPNVDIPLAELQRRTVEALSRGLRLAGDTRSAESTLASLEAQVEPAARGVFLRERVELLLQADAADEAVETAQSAASTLLPDDQDVKLALGRALVRQGSDLDEAGRLLRSVIEERPEEADAFASLGDLASRQDTSEAAIASYDRALELAPDHWQALSGRIRVLDRIGRQAEALASLETYLDRHNPYDGRAALELAKRLEEEGASRARRLGLARRAIRFGAGPEAVDLLASIDPDEAAKLRPAEPEADPADPDPAGRANDLGVDGPGAS
ncbi:MAG: hypothetical protein CL908_24045 [Deltaproteobacteria bacterium]|nr:hypothetical protein [Deltaproteobacteria bacterium]